jgi:hypothetical protein
LACSSVAFAFSRLARAAERLASEFSESATAPILIEDTRVHLGVLAAFAPRFSAHPFSLLHLLARPVRIG